MLKILKKLKAAALAFGLCSLSSVALAITPGTYYCSMDNVEEGTYGSLVICRLEDEQGRIAPVELVGITAYDGVESQHYYAGVIQQNDAQIATATILYELTKSEFIQLCFEQKFTSGKWLAELDAKKPNLRICLNSNNHLSFESINGAAPLEIPMQERYRYMGEDISLDNNVALSVVALNKVKALRGLSAEVRNQQYITNDNEKFKQRNIQVKEGNNITEYVVSKDLSRITMNYDGGNRSQELLSFVPKAAHFGNAVITGDDVLVRQEPSTKAEIVGVVNKGDRVKVWKYCDGERVDGQYKWATVRLKDGTYGHIYGKYVKEGQ